MDQIQIISIDSIDRPLKISREVIDPERVRELAESIREVGLLEPVLIRPVNGRYEMVAGDRRYLAHKLLGLKEINAIVKPLDDRETVVTRGIENLQRVNLTPSEESQVYLLMKIEGEMSIAGISKRTGKTEKTISRYLNFAKFSEEVRRSVDRKEISLNCLEVLQEIDDPDQFMYFWQMASQNGITEKTARLWVDDYHKTKAGTYYSEGGGERPGNLTVELRPAYMTCDICSGPIEMRQVKNVISCPECLQKARANKNV